MHILLTGATGFIGRRLRAQLLARGHHVVGTSRDPSAGPGDGTRWVTLDFATATQPQDWNPHLDGIDTVINSAGLFAEHGAATGA